MEDLEEEAVDDVVSSESKPEKEPISKLNRGLSCDEPDASSSLDLL